MFEIKQLYVKEKRNKNSSSYDVHMIDRNNRDIKLVSGFDDSEQALYIEQKIESFLGIAHVHVRGSVG